VGLGVCMCVRFCTRFTVCLQYILVLVKGLTRFCKLLCVSCHTSHTHVHKHTNAHTIALAKQAPTPSAVAAMCLEMERVKTATRTEVATEVTTLPCHGAAQVGLLMLSAVIFSSA
jgi:hypothetical protein